MGMFTKPRKIIWNKKDNLLLSLCQDGNMISEMLFGIFPCDIQGLVIQWNDHTVINPGTISHAVITHVSYPLLNKIDFCGFQNST